MSIADDDSMSEQEKMKARLAAETAAASASVKKWVSTERIDNHPPSPC